MKTTREKTTRERFEEMVVQLPSLRLAPGASPWDAEVLLRWLCETGQSHGEALAARFVLGVWNVHADWEQLAREKGLTGAEKARRFDVLEAAGVWDRVHLDVLQAWLEAPFFP